MLDRGLYPVGLVTKHDVEPGETSGGRRLERAKDQRLPMDGV
jgi:hypothetical protein